MTSLLTSNVGSARSLHSAISGTPSSTTSSSPRSLGLCAECGSRITSVVDACQAMGCIYHSSCFVCCCCRRSLRGKIFYKDQSKVYCEEDYLYCGFQRTAEKCVVCGHIIAEVILQAMGQYYHPGCFRCTICNECLEEAPFAVDSNNAVYCVMDYHLVHAPRCAKCGIPIMPEPGTDEIKRVVAMNREFHVDCYRCVDCNVDLHGAGEKGCYPLAEENSHHLSSISSSPNVHLLCLTCHIRRIGATPAAGQEFNANDENFIPSSRVAGGSGSSSSYQPQRPVGRYTSANNPQTPTRSNMASPPWYAK